MRNIVTLYLTDVDQHSTCNSASDDNELMLSIVPLPSQKTGFKVEITDRTGTVTVSEVLQPEDGYIVYTIEKTFWYTTGTMKIRLLSDEENSEYVEFNTLIDLMDGDAAICKAEGAAFNISKKASQTKDIFPVGYVYISVVNTNPAEWFGGTWERFGKGKTLIGVDENDTDFETVKKTGGEKTHKLTATEIPAHNHSVTIESGGAHTHTASSGSAGAHTPAGTVASKTLTGAFDLRDIMTTDHNTILGGATGICAESYVSWSGSHWAMNGQSASSYYKNRMTITATHNHTFTGTAVAAHTHTVTVASGGSHTHTATAGNTGGSGAHNNLQPYITTYMWVRTA